MKRFTRIFVFVSVFGLLFAAGALAQATVKPPFLGGEKLVYEGKISKIIQGIAVADLSFTFGKTADGDDYLIRTDARSKGTLLKLFRFSFVQEYESTVDSDKFRVLKTVKNDVQKERVRNSEALSVMSKKGDLHGNQSKGNRCARRTIASDLKGDTHDLVSGLYFLRTLPLAVGRVFELTISDSGLIYQVPVASPRAKFKNQSWSPDASGLNRKCSGTTG
ncbi:MAG: DUF3108 domain-containing protein [Acidobacteria bacterium]|nr:DUF3108 domain-containing protein [Acidobacteriota bacterium]